MSSLQFARSELATAIQKGISQCVLIGSDDRLKGAIDGTGSNDLRLFLVSDQPLPELAAAHVPAAFESGTLATALENSDFSKLKATLFVWLGTGYRTAEAAIASLSFIASLPKGSAVLFDYAVERTSASHLAVSALDALASRLAIAGGAVKHLIQPAAVRALLGGIGFQHIVDVTPADLAGTGGHLVSATI